MGVKLNASEMMLAGGLVVVAGLGVWIASRGARGVAQDTARVATDAVTGAATGVIHGISEAVGIPVPERSACDAAKASGDTWAASRDCPAGEFFSYWWGGHPDAETLKAPGTSK